MSVLGGSAMWLVDGGGTAAAAAAESPPRRGCGCLAHGVEYWWLLPRGAAAPLVLDIFEHFFEVFLLALPGMSVGACGFHFMLFTVLKPFGFGITLGNTYGLGFAAGSCLGRIGASALGFQSSCPYFP